VAVSGVIAPACPDRPALARGHGRSGRFDGDAAAKMSPRPKGSPSRVLSGLVPTGLFGQPRHRW
jgi:hypothetical protein